MIEHSAKENLPGHGKIRERNRFAKAAGHDLAGRSFVDALSGETLEKHNAQRPDIGTGSNLSALKLFRSHVGDGPSIVPAIVSVAAS